jgi:hypothetical protein
MYNVNLWKTASSLSPELSADIEADDPLEAAFALMRRAGLSYAYAVLVLSDLDEPAVEYTDVECPAREVC